VNRRGFLGALAAFAAGAVLDPERLLWVPGQKTIFLPSQNTLIDPDWVCEYTWKEYAGTLVFTPEDIAWGKQQDFIAATQAKAASVIRGFNIPVGVHG
jgi:hypothetical protein